MKHAVPLRCITVALLCLAGCHGDPQPVGVRGTVMLDGKPLKTGVIEFEPLGELRGQRRDAPIVDGKFELPARMGLLSGMEFKVSIKAFKKTGKKYPAANPALAFDEEVQYLPEMYNALSKLNVAVSASESENAFEFELHSQER